MDGRTAHPIGFPSQHSRRAALLAACLLLAACPTLAHAQAMGKVAVDSPSVAAPSKAPDPAPATDTPKTATPAPITPVHNQMLDILNLGTPILPLVEPKSQPAAAAPAKSDKTPPTPAEPLKTVDPPKAAATFIPLENRPIRPPAPETIAPTPVADVVPVTTPGTRSNFSGLGNLGQVTAALAIVIGLILIGRALVRKFVPGAKASNGKGVIEVLARHPLAKNQSIVLIRIGSQIVALNQGKEASESVLVISDPTEVARIIGQIEGRSPHSSQAGFNSLLANARVDLETAPEDDQTAQAMGAESLDEQLDEMAAAKRQLLELRQHVRSVRDSLPRA